MSTIFEVVGILVLGVLARLLLFVVFFAALTVPIGAAQALYEGLKRSSAQRHANAP